MQPYNHCIRILTDLQEVLGEILIRSDLPHFTCHSFFAFFVDASDDVPTSDWP